MINLNVAGLFLPALLQNAEANSQSITNSSALDSIFSNILGLDTQDQQQETPNNQNILLSIIVLLLTNLLKKNDAEESNDFVYAEAKDGKIDLEKGIEKSAEALSKSDKNEDGKVSIAELISKTQTEGYTEAEAEKYAEIFNFNGDDKYDKFEDITLSLYKDKNKDGVITDEENAAFNEQIKSDPNGVKMGLIETYLAATGTDNQSVADKADKIRGEDHFDTTNHTSIIDMYKTLLDRDAEGDGYKYWLDAMNGGMTKQQVRTAFINSDEYKANNN